MINEIERGQLCDQTISALRHGSIRLGNIPDLIKRIIRERAWECRQVKLRPEFVKLRSLRELITTTPMEGWGEAPKKIEALLKGDPEAEAMFREAMKGQEGGDKKSEKAKINGDNITNDRARVTGTSRAYTVSRLQRERPDLFAQVKAGKLSANKAAIEAGFRKQPSALERLRAAWRKATPEEREELRREIKVSGHPCPFCGGAAFAHSCP